MLLFTHESHTVTLRSGFVRRFLRPFSSKHHPVECRATTIRRYLIAKIDIFFQTSKKYAEKVNICMNMHSVPGQKFAGCKVGV